MFYRKLWRDYLESVLLAVFLGLFVRTFIWTAYRVPTATMSPTLLPGDFIFAYRLPYGIQLPLMHDKLVVNAPKLGDVVVFTLPMQPKVTYVKRVVGMPGDRIEIISGVLSRNGKKMNYSLVENSLVLAPGEPSSLQAYLENDSESSHTVWLRKEGLRKSLPALVVPPDEVFLIGDNRDIIDDPASWSTVPIDRIEGRVQRIWLSLDWTQKEARDFLPHLRTERFFAPVP